MKVSISDAYTLVAMSYITNINNLLPFYNRTRTLYLLHTPECMLSGHYFWDK